MADFYHLTLSSYIHLSHHKWQVSSFLRLCGILPCTPTTLLTARLSMDIEVVPTARLLCLILSQQGVQTSL